MENERRQENADRLHELGDRVTRLETQRQSDFEAISSMNRSVVTLITKIDTLSLQLNTLQTERKVIVGLAGFLGGIVTLCAEWLMRIFTTKGG